MKVKGSELAVWMAEGWPAPEDDWCWDHELFEEAPAPEEVYDTDELGGLIFQGRGDDPTRGDGYDIGKLIRKWRKERDFDIITIEVPKARTEEIKSAIAALGVKTT
jgi:hypothetical protein